jgi:hypothetical protein
VIQQHPKWIGYDLKALDQVMYSEGFYLSGVKTENLEKSEIRISKFETIPNVQNSNVQNNSQG